MPVARLQQALGRVRQGELGTRLPVDTEDEFGQLAAGFNLMAHALQTSHDDLESKVREDGQCRGSRTSAWLRCTEVSARRPRRAPWRYCPTVLCSRCAGWRGRCRGDALVGRGQRAVCDSGRRRHARKPWWNRNTACTPVAAWRADGRAGHHPGDSDHGTLSPWCCRIATKRATRPWWPFQWCCSSVCWGEINLFFRSEVELTAEMRELVETMVRHLASSMEGLRAAALEREAAVAEERSLLARECTTRLPSRWLSSKIQTQLLR